MINAGDGRNGNHSLRYRQCPIPRSVYLKHAAPCAYRDLMRNEVQTRRNVLLGYMYSLYFPVKKKSADDSLYRNTVTVEMMEEVEKYGALNVPTV